jgi:phospholipase C
VRPRHTFPAARAAAAAAALGVAACLGHGPSSVEASPLRSVSGGVIQHVVYIIQENRSFNNLFYKFKGAKTQGYGYNTLGQRIPLHEQSIDTSWDIDHSLSAFLTDYDSGLMDGWNNESACCGQPANFAYAYAPKSQTKTYWEMAEQYVLADEFFQSHLDGSFIAHQYAIAAYANSEVDFPSSWWGCQGGPSDVVATITSGRGYGSNVPVCEDYQTLGDELDAASLPWRFYTYPYDQDGGIWSAYSAIDHIINGPDWSNVITPAGQFVADVDAGNLAAVTWITPLYENSDHAGVDSTGGPKWVASLVNVVGNSKFWDSTVIFITWDDWGGWFDPVKPIYKDYDGLGFRVPLIAISAYAHKGYVSHVQYESSSVLRFAEDNFGLPQLAASDARAADPASDFFDFSQAPRTFVPFTVPPARRSRWNGVRPPVGGD